jgi:hypothetical protein
LLFCHRWEDQVAKKKKAVGEVVVVVVVGDGGDVVAAALQIATQATVHQVVQGDQHGEHDRSRRPEVHGRERVHTIRNAFKGNEVQRKYAESAEHLPERSRKSHVEAPSHAVNNLSTVTQKVFFCLKQTGVERNPQISWLKFMNKRNKWEVGLRLISRLSFSDLVVGPHHPQPPAVDTTDRSPHLGVGDPHRYASACPHVRHPKRSDPNRGTEKQGTRKDEKNAPCLAACNANTFD